MAKSKKKKKQKKEDKYKHLKKIKTDKVDMNFPELDPEIQKQSQGDVDNMEHWFKRRPKHKSKDKRK